MTRIESISASVIGSAPSQKGFSAALIRPRQRGCSAPPSSGRARSSKRLERPFRLARDQSLVFFAP